MKTRKLLSITIWFVIILSIATLITLTVSCQKATQTSTATETSLSSESSTTEEPVANETNDINEIKKLVEDFGKVLANVPLQSPPDLLENAFIEYYSPFVSEDLIKQWINNPEEALGRLTSSPWPDHIEISDLKKITIDKYEVYGNVVEITSIEVVEGGYADKYGVTLTVERINDKWLITDAKKEIATYSGDEITTNQ